MQKVLIIGAGMAGSDASFFLAEKGFSVVLVEGKTVEKNPAQKMSTYAELVCTNSLKSKDPHSAHGLLKYEMKAMGSLTLRCAEKHAVPAGEALAVDRDLFSQEVTAQLKSHPRIEVKEAIVEDPVTFANEQGCQWTIVATGPLTSRPLEMWIQEHISGEDFYFYDAIAPVVDADGLDYQRLYYKDRHRPVPEEEGMQADYLNVPLTKEEYEDFIQELVRAGKTPAQDFEDWKFFESCLPIDLMAERGKETARFGPMKPIGLELPGGELPHACLQLRRENLLGSAFNLVGFQTRLKYSEQVRVFRQLPGFQKARFLHLGSVHRNSFLNSKKVLNSDLSCREFPSLFFAGQITGVEGYTESAAMGLYAAFQIWRKSQGWGPSLFPVETGIGALVNYIMTSQRPAPSNINFGLLPKVELTKEERRDRYKRKKIKKEKAANRAKASFDNFLREMEI